MISMTPPRPMRVDMWRDIDGNLHATLEYANAANLAIIEVREKNNKRRILFNHVDKAFDDWLKYTEHDTACDYRTGALKICEYLLRQGYMNADTFMEDGDKL